MRVRHCFGCDFDGEMKLGLIGDVHGDMDKYLALTESLGTIPSIQVGDFGAGFVSLPKLNLQHRFIRGNHDSPDVCRTHPNYLGDYGLLEPSTFYISGAESIDKAYRTIGISWWPEEELSYEELSAAIRLYMSVKPNTVISHECPLVAARDMLSKLYIGVSPRGDKGQSRTAQALQVMFEKHQPLNWYFGHYHFKREFRIGRTTFRCVAEKELAIVEVE